VAEEHGAWRKRHVIDVAVQGLVHSKHELSQSRFLSSHARMRDSDCVVQSVVN
jgi:hypothetical protein